MNNEWIPNLDLAKIMSLWTNLQLQMALARLTIVLQKKPCLPAIFWGLYHVSPKEIVYLDSSASDYYYLRFSKMK